MSLMKKRILSKAFLIRLFKQVYFDGDKIIEKNTKILRTRIEDNDVFRRLKVTVDKIIKCVVSSGFKLTDDGKAYVIINQEVTFDFDYLKKKGYFQINGRKINNESI